jgi:sphinganine-1-phosphate aldolase
MAKRKTIPTDGRPTNELLDELESMRSQDGDWKKGRVFSLVYYAGEEFHDFLKKAHNLYFAENYLNPGVFKSLKRMESDLVEMTASMLNAPPDAVGTLTSGGTESLLLAVKSARDRAKKLKPWIRQPEMVAPLSVHPAVDKACSYFGVKLRKADLRDDKRVDVEHFKSLVGRNTVLVMASAPQYPHGVIDPIPEIGAFAKERGIPFHVDSCIGGFVLPWMEKLGRTLHTWDFRVPGVTSISADLHKYGYAPKGTSCLVYRDMSYLRHQFFIATDFPGGIYASPTIPGTRPGGAISSAWGAVNALGESGYLRHTRDALAAVDKLRAGVLSMPELELVAEPDATLVAYRATDASGLDTYAIADKLEDLGWVVDRQQKPACIHCTITSNHLAIIDDYVSALREAVAFVVANPEVASRGNAAMYGLVAKVPFRGMVKTSVLKVMEAMYAPGGGDLDLANAEGDGFADKILQKYRPQAMAIFDSFEKLREMAKGRGRRRS